jgi:alpha-D-xyloside xylohydrolase
MSKESSMNVRSWRFVAFAAFVFGPAIVSLTGCSPSGFQKRSDGVVIRLDKTRSTDARLMKVQVCTDDIIRVVASPTDAFSKRSSLMVAQTKWKPVAYSVERKDDTVQITTSKVIGKVSLRTGEISFYDKNGYLYVQERAGGGKTITDANVTGERTYQIRQVFQSPSDEAFYGLGQHQNAVMNWRGQDVDMFQYNLVDIVPFVVSSRNYGILWDNNSRMKFGDPRDYQPLSTLKLYGTDGKEGGLTAEYFNDEKFQTVLISRPESVIAHENLDELGGYPEAFNPTRGSVRWSGEVGSDQAGIHSLRLYSSHYAKVWLNGKLVIDSWRQNWCPWTNFLQLQMEPGKRYPIKIEWIPNGGYIGLKCLTPHDPKDNDTMSLWSEVADQIDYYFIAGRDIDGVIGGYRTVTGKAPMMPKWAMGFWQCRERYQNQQQLLDVVKEFRKREIPLDNIVQDWFYWPENKWGDHDFDTSRYPNAAGMVKELHNNLNTHVMISVWPKFYVGTRNYNAFKAKGWLYMRNVEKGQKDWVGPGYVSTFYDPYSDGARELFWKQINEKLFSKGFDAWWLDSTEPDIQSNLSMDEWRLRIGPTAMGSASRYLNTYSLMNAKGVYEGQRKTNPDQRVFILTRSTYAGQQRYGTASWSGDTATRWYDLKAQISAGVNLCMSGLPYWTMDIGGFAVEPRFERNVTREDLEEWRELNARWFQFGAFCPLFRSHGQSPSREMFNIAPNGHPAYETMVAYDKLRYRLMPYIYSLAGMVTQDDYTMMRGLVMDFGQDTNVFNINDQFMFGPSLLVNPVCEYKARTRKVYLPAKTVEWVEVEKNHSIVRDSRIIYTGWYDFKTGKYFKGGQTVDANAPLTEMPIFVKAGSIIPFGPAIQYAAEKPADPIRLVIYTGGDAQFKLYEDENVNYNYEKGAFSTISLNYDETTRSLTIGARQGQFPGMSQTRTFEIVWASRDKPAALNLDAVPAQSVRYDGKEIVVKQR